MIAFIVDIIARELELVTEKKNEGGIEHVDSFSINGTIYVDFMLALMAVYFGYDIVRDMVNYLRPRFNAERRPYIFQNDIILLNRAWDTLSDEERIMAVRELMRNPVVEYLMPPQNAVNLDQE